MGIRPEITDKRIIRATFAQQAARDADGATHFMVALRALNDAAYAAAKAARASNSPLSDKLRTLALCTDDMVDGVAA